MCGDWGGAGGLGGTKDSLRNARSGYTVNVTGRCLGGG